MLVRTWGHYNSTINLYLVPELTLTFGKANSATWLYENDTLTMNSTFLHNDVKSLSTEHRAYYNGQKSLIGYRLKSRF